MKCLINTFYCFNNYGTKLQNYALRHVLLNYFDDVSTVYLINKKMILKKIAKKILTLFPVVTDNQKVWRNEVLKEKKFKNFNENLGYKYLTKKKLEKNNYDDTIAIAGSDQIWSPSHLLMHKYDIDLFFMRYINLSKRFTYAPSFGNADIPAELKKMYKKNLNEITELSVREKEGYDAIKKLTKQNVIIVPDPVFLLTKKEWLTISANKITKNKYLLTYFLGPKSNNILIKIMDYATIMKLQVVNLAGNNYEKGQILLSPNEFISAINNAECVISDSFHAAAFSIIMKTPFQIFERLDVNQSSRIINLYNTFEMENILISKESIFNNDFQINPLICQNSDKLLENQRKKGIKYIEKIIQKI